MSPLLQTLSTNSVMILVVMLGMWLISLKLANSSIVDPFWGAGFVLVAWVSWLINWPVSGRAWLIVVLTTLWGVRLTSFLLFRNR